MGVQAKRDFPEINHRKAIMAGDSLSDMQFGKRLKMLTVFIDPDPTLARENPRLIDLRFKQRIEVICEMSDVFQS